MDIGTFEYALTYAFGTIIFLICLVLTFIFIKKR